MNSSGYSNEETQLNRSIKWLDLELNFKLRCSLEWTTTSGVWGWRRFSSVTKLWKFVDQGSEIPDEPEKERIVVQDLIAQDAKALGLFWVQFQFSNKIFPQIANQETAKAAWNVLKQGYRGDLQVRAVTVIYKSELWNSKVFVKILTCSYEKWWIITCVFD